MKILNTLLYTFLLLISFTYEVRIRKISMKQDTTYPDNFFDGNWESTSYGCTAEQPTRVVMSATNDLIEAIKLTDADCVEKGHPTLRLAARANYQETGTYPCDVILGYKGNPQSSSSDDCKIIIHDCNNYELKNTYFSLYFKRSEEFPDCKKAFLPETPEQSLPDNCQVKRMVPALKSTDYSVALNVKFINKTGKTVKIIWMDYNGGEVEYNTLKNTMFYTQQTYATHPWIFKIGNKAIGYYTPGFDNENLTEVFIEDPEECNSNNTPAVIKPHEPVGQYPYPVEFFDGDWESESYGCTESQPTRVNMFTNEQGNVEAVKLTDAQCVEKGHATLKFNGKPDYKIPGNYACEIILGYAGNPQSSSSHDCKIEIVNCNHYKAIHPYFTLDFTRTQEIEFCDKAFPVEPTDPVNDLDQDQDPVNDDDIYPDPKPEPEDDITPDPKPEPEDDITPDPKPEPEDDQEEHDNIDPDNYCEDEVEIKPQPDPKPNPDNKESSTDSNSNDNAAGGNGESASFDVPFLKKGR